MTSIIPLPRTGQTPPDVRYVAWLLEVTEPDLHALALDGETGEERAARLAAASDIVDELAAEYRTEVGDTPVEYDPWFETEGRAA